MGAKIASIGYQLPPIRVSNADWTEKFAPRAELLGNDQPGTAPMKLWDELLGFEAARRPSSLAEVGNVSICSIPFTLRRMLDSRSLEENQLLLLLTPASGQHVISMVWRW